jgi:AraC family transcriptional regulator
MPSQFFISTQNIIPFSQNGIIKPSPVDMAIVETDDSNLAGGTEDNSSVGTSTGVNSGSRSTSCSAFAVVEIAECLLRHLEDLNTTHPHLTDDLLETSPVLSRLAKALSEAGIEPGDLNGCTENAVRLAIVASLFDLRISPPTEPDKKRSVPAMQKWRLIRVLKYIDASISDRLALTDLATVAGISRMYFAGQFRAATGVRPHDYVQRRRIEHAQRLLRMSNLPLSEIAQSVGFQTQSHFTTTFKRFVGSTPYRWRRGQNAR